MIDLLCTLAQPCEGYRCNVIPEEGGHDEPEGTGCLENLSYEDGLNEIGFVCLLCLCFYFCMGNMKLQEDVIISSDVLGVIIWMRN